MSRAQQGEVYLLGSVHVLPPHLQWRTAAIRRGLSRSDVYVFEVPQDEKAVTELQGLIQAKGYLPQDQSLRALLHAEARPDLTPRWPRPACRWRRWITTGPGWPASS